MSAEKFKKNMTRKRTSNNQQASSQQADSTGEAFRYIHAYKSKYIYIYIYPPLCFELLMRTKALLLQFRVLFPDICEELSFWVVAGGCPDKHFGDKRWAP